FRLSLTARHNLSLGMVPKTAMSEIRNESFRLVEPVVDRQVVLCLAAKFSGAAFSVLEWVGHD
ncbi:MAG: hypothetical protein WCA27_11430, partial [Candidatus Sulfotelmatobacter sp.]